jgi:hypothetical protein
MDANEKLPGSNGNALCWIGAANECEPRFNANGMAIQDIRAGGKSRQSCENSPDRSLENYSRLFASIRG